MNQLVKHMTKLCAALCGLLVITVSFPPLDRGADGFVTVALADDDDDEVVTTTAGPRRPADRATVEPENGNPGKASSTICGRADPRPGSAAAPRFR